MFADFNRTFKNKTQTRLTVPSALLKHLSDSLPEGLSYTLDEKGQCIITNGKDTMTLGGFEVNPTPHQREILGEHFTYEALAQYMYNSQQSIPLKLNNEGYLSIDGEEIPIDKIAFDYYNPIEYVSGSFFMSPSPLPEPFQITIGCKEYSKQIMISRVPDDSIRYHAFESNKDSPLHIRYVLDTLSGGLEFSISFKFSSSITVQEIIESATIYNAFLEGNGYVVGNRLEGTIIDDSAKEYDKNALDFWKKVYQIENKLQLRFKPTKSETDYHTLYLVEILYQNLIEHKAAIYNQNINEISGNWKENELKDSIGHPMYFEFVTHLKTNLFGEEINLPSLWGIMNAVLSDYQIYHKKKTIRISDNAPDKPMRTVIFCFATEEELTEYRKQEHSTIIQNFKDAVNPISNLA